jgi:hypothetical protein
LKTIGSESHPAVNNDAEECRQHEKPKEKHKDPVFPIFSLSRVLEIVVFLTPQAAARIQTQPEQHTIMKCKRGSD